MPNSICNHACGLCLQNASVLLAVQNTWCGRQQQKSHRTNSYLSDRVYTMRTCTHILQLQWINQHCIRALYRINRHRFRRWSGTDASFHTKVRTDNCQKLQQQLLLLLHPFNGLFSRTTWVSRYQKGKTSLDLNKARYGEVLGCSGISWTVCKQSTPRSRHNHTNTPSLNLYRPDALPDVQATV